jgi:hypothetical protein
LCREVSGLERDRRGRNGWRRPGEELTTGWRRAVVLAVFHIPLQMKV